ncbi:PrpF domain-containing protein, partial [Pseudomonas syringae group genomosp. 7]|uniref:PrpF domain-containing protein n=1 Tax=Pseudomonas syringae group genomosp. 7 TaxID=251699 RepID=UPI00376F497B
IVYLGTELLGFIIGDPNALARLDAIRAHGAVRMGLIRSIVEAATRQQTPYVWFVAAPAEYLSSSCISVAALDIDLLVRV